MEEYSNVSEQSNKHLSKIIELDKELNSIKLNKNKKIQEEENYILKFTLSETK